jgi:hypothetical protein
VAGIWDIRGRVCDKTEIDIRERERESVDYSCLKKFLFLFLQPPTAAGDPPQQPQQPWWPGSFPSPLGNATNVDQRIDQLEKKMASLNARLLEEVWPKIEERKENYEIINCLAFIKR